MQNQEIFEHVTNTGKVAVGGVGVGGVTHEVFANIEQMTQLANLAAYTATFIYFVVSAGYTVWKWRKAAKNAAAK